MRRLSVRPRRWPLALAVIACTVPATPAAAADAAVRRAGLLQDRRLPARLHPGRHPGDPRPRRGQQLHRHRHRGRRRLHHRQPRPVRGGRLPQHHRRRAQRHPADRVRVATSARGGGYVGVHAAADTEYDWPFYGSLVGACFASHPAIQQATVKVEDRAHAATAHLPQTWTRTDEWYNYRTNPRSTARVLATPRRVVVLRRDDGRRPPDHLVQDRTTAAGPSTPALGHTRRPTPTRPSAPTCSAASGTRPGAPRPTAGPSRSRRRRPRPRTGCRRAGARGSPARRRTPGVAERRCRTDRPPSYGLAPGDAGGRRPWRRRSRATRPGWPARGRWSGGWCGSCTTRRCGSRSAAGARSPACARSSTLTVACWIAGCEANQAPTRSP